MDKLDFAAPMPPYTMLPDGGGMNLPNQYMPDLGSDTWLPSMQPQPADNWLPSGVDGLGNVSLASAWEQAGRRHEQKPQGGRRADASAPNMEVMGMQTQEAQFAAEMMTGLMSSLAGGHPMPGNSDGGCFASPLPEEDGMRAPAMFNGSAVAPPAEWANITTVMMRNLPNKYTQRMLLTEINCTGFLGSFDFLYLPIDPETNANRGYAFLNFIGPSFAWMFKMSYEGNKMNRFNSNKVVSVVPATLQGFEANYAHYASARVNRGDPAARPLFLREPSQQLTNLTKAKGSDARRGGRQRRGGANSLEHLLETQSGQEGGYPGGQEWALGPGPMDTYFGLEGGMDGDLAKGPDSSPRESAQPLGAAGMSGASPMVPKFCPHCGGAIQPLFQFCPQCGASMNFSANGSAGGPGAAS